MSSLLCAAPVVSNVSALQRAGTKLVDITYDVKADASMVRISLEISNDGGQTFTVPSVTTSGAVGCGIVTGTGKVITWNAGVDWDGQTSSKLLFNVMADVFFCKSQPAPLPWAMRWMVFPMHPPTQ